MHTFQFKISSQSAQQVLNKLLEFLKSDPQLEIVREGDIVEIRSVEKENMMLPGSPMTWEELKSEIAQSEKDHENGEFITAEDLRTQVEKW